MSYEYLIDVVPLPSVEKLLTDVMDAGYMCLDSGREHICISTPESFEATRKWGGEIYIEWRAERDSLFLTINSLNPQKSLAKILNVIALSGIVQVVEEL